MTKLRREKKLIPQEQKGMGDKGRRRFDTWSTAVSEMSPTPTTRPALIFKALSPADSTGPLPSSSQTRGRGKKDRQKKVKNYLKKAHV